MFLVKCDSPACENAAEIEEVEIPTGWLVIVETAPGSGPEASDDAVELGVFCSRACVAFYAGMESPG